MDPDSKEKTAFITPDGLYKFNVMPFSLCNDHATIQRLMQCVLVGLGGDKGFCNVFIDDILILIMRLSMLNICAECLGG